MKYLPFLTFDFDICYRITKNFLEKTPLGVVNKWLQQNHYTPDASKE